MEMEGLTRRGFIGSVTVAAIGVTAASVLGGCKSESSTGSEEPENIVLVDQLNP